MLQIIEPTMLSRVRARTWRDWSKARRRSVALQDEIAKAVVVALKGRLLPEARPVLKLSTTSNPEAYRLFLLGRSFLLAQTDESGRRSEEALERAVALDPSYGIAWDYRVGRLKEASASMRKVVETDPLNRYSSAR